MPGTGRAPPVGADSLRQHREPNPRPASAATWGGCRVPSPGTLPSSSTSTIARDGRGGQRRKSPHGPAVCPLAPGCGGRPRKGSPGVAAVTPSSTVGWHPVAGQAIAASPAGTAGLPGLPSPSGPRGCAGRAVRPAADPGRGVLAGCGERRDQAGVAVLKTMDNDAPDVRPTPRALPSPRCNGRTGRRRSAWHGGRRPSGPPGRWRARPSSRTGRGGRLSAANTTPRVSAVTSWQRWIVCAPSISTSGSTIGTSPASWDRAAKRASASALASMQVRVGIPSPMVMTARHLVNLTPRSR